MTIHPHQRRFDRGFGSQEKICTFTAFHMHKRRSLGIFLWFLHLHGISSRTVSPSRHWFDHPLPCPPGSHISLCQDVSAPPCVSGEGLGIFTSMVDICLLTVQSLWRLRLFGRYFVDGSIQCHSCFCSFLFWMFVSLLKLLLCSLQFEREHVHT